ncbi:allantoate amidohydrolase [Nocardioides bruguierae]|uniref:Allantoate amidohydrolase n=1 Tax=Nocardioides bruguierae TaxID=2945102 RepID=A0A9X2D7N5_9ACTN|nr:allantoate amidohydrolase [Nocardioides bruguierae]MCM0620327.1 allantoate amidohydrolase [Nocardioides bruguierae]
MVDDFERMWADLAPVGRSAATGGYFRQPWTSAENELRAWFVGQAAARGLRLETDLLGNMVAWWEAPGAEGPSVLTGSHLDSVLDGGAFDGPLGVVSAFAAVDVLRARGVAPVRPLGVSAFVEEEGSRFGLACLGSRLVTGEVALEDALARRDRAGTSLEDALAAADLGTGSLLDLANVGCFVELHVEQGRHLVDTDAVVGLASEIWPHGRYRFDVTGRADHAGATRMEDRHDPMLTFAMTTLAANKQARLAGQRATFGRLDVAPNSTNAVPSRVTGWLDARADSDVALAALVDAIARQAADRAERDGTALTVTPESVSASVAFDVALTSRIGRIGARTRTGAGAGDEAWPVIPSAAGHDAGILAAAGVPTAMLFVRNPTGVSHSPEESAETGDCLVGVEALADVLAELLT